MKRSLVAFGIVAVTCAAGMAEPVKTDEPKVKAEFGPPFPMVMIPRTADDKLESLAKQVAAAIGVQTVGRSDYNPVCCVWIQIVPWIPNPGTGGYLIINQSGGSIIQASDIDQMKEGVTRFKSSIRMNDGKAEVPMGMLTNYPVIN